MAVERSGSASSGQGDALPPLPPGNPSVPPFEPGRVDRLRSDSFRPSPELPGLLVRPVAMAEKYSQGKALVRMLKADPDSRAAPASAPIQAPGIKLIYILKGSAGFDIEGLDDTRLEQGTLACLPPRNRHRLVTASPDFEDIEFQLPLLTASLARTWSPDGPACATAAMIDRETPDSFNTIPNFLGAIERRFPIVQEMTGGGANASVLRANPPHIWDGTPWHVHHNNFFCSLFAKGSGTMGYDGFGDCRYDSGDMFIQHGELRHREVLFSPDFETVKIELPGVSPTTVLVYDKNQDAYQPMMFTSAQESAKVMA